MPWNEGIEGPALNIAASLASPIRVMAGPGTGKSFALKRRVQRLLEEGVDPHTILACTFTRTAAADLKKDLQNLGVPGSENIKASTLHALCFGILMKRDVLAATDRIPRPLMDFEEEFLVGDLSHYTRFGGKRDIRKRLLAFNAAWARLQSEQPGWPRDQIDRDFHDKLLHWLCFHESMLIGELVPLALRYLRDNPMCEERARYAHVLVDEYQDLNVAEQSVAALLASSGSFAIIGDEDQSIYTFKHAHPEGITNFHETNPDTHDETLDICRRCPTNIVEMSNYLISHNQSRQPRELTPFSENPPGDVRIIQWASLQDEVSGISEFVNQQIASGDVDAGDVLILAPSRLFGYKIRDRLNEMGIQSVSFFSEEALKGNPQVLDESSAQQAMTLLSLLARPSDRVALRSWCGFGSPSLRSGAWKQIVEYCSENNLSPDEVLKKLHNGSIKIPRTKELVDRYTILQNQLAELDELNGPGLVNSLFPLDQEWSAPFRQISDSIEEPDYSPTGLENIIRNGIAHQEIPEDVDFVRVMSLHKSKGLTAKLVVIIGCIEGLIPRIPDTGDSAERNRALEEQRRLFYVGITRARNTLVLSSITRLPTAEAFRMGIKVRKRYRNLATTITSRFIEELGPTSPKPIAGNNISNSLYP